MTEKEKQNKEVRKYLVISILFVVSIAIIGLSLSYAYFTLNFFNPDEEDPKTVPPNTAANLNVTSTVETTEPIDTNELVLISASEVGTKAEHVQFTVTNESDSTIAASYTINLVEMQISKNLLSKYFKWKIVVTHGDNTPETSLEGTFEDENCTPDVNGAVNGVVNGVGECHYTLPEATGEYEPKDKEMMVYDGKEYRTKTASDTVDGVLNSTLELEKIDTLNIGITDTIDFYIWLEDDNVDQIYLTNGLFSGKLSITAVPKAN